MRARLSPRLFLLLACCGVLSGCGDGWYAGDDGLGGIGADLFISAPGYVGYDGGGPYYGYGMPGFFGGDDWGDDD